MSIEKITLDELYKYVAFISIDKNLLKNAFNRLNVLGNLKINACMVFGKDMRPIYESVCDIEYERFLSNSMLLQMSKNNREIFNSFFKDRLHNYGCSISHTHAIKHAKENNWPFILIFEDDVVPCINCLEHLTTALNKLPEDWEVLKFEDSYNELIPEFNKIPIDSPNNYISYKLINNWWRKNFPNNYRTLNNLCIGMGTCAYIVNASIYDKILDQFENESKHEIYYTPISDIRIFDYKLYYYSKMLFCQCVHYEQYKKCDSAHWPNLKVLKVPA